MKVWLDDLRQAPDGWVRTYNSNMTIEMLGRGNVTHLSLDHDLGNEDIVGNGYMVMEWLEEEASYGNFYIDPNNIKFHTANIVGRKKMNDALNKIKIMQTS